MTLMLSIRAMNGGILRKVGRADSDGTHNEQFLYYLRGNFTRREKTTDSFIIDDLEPSFCLVILLESCSRAAAQEVR
jgi:hypothetical protein